MFLLLISCVLIASTQLLNAENQNPIIVSTPLGRIQGSILTTVLGKPIHSFRGIRYAKAPVGELRFKPPVPVDKWSHVYDGTKDGPACPQPVLPIVSEDCLFLNVYTTKLPQGANNPKRPVIIFIHPGGFYGLTGASYAAGPDYFLDQDIVLVTLNYRLGSLGFISTGDELAPGNNGLKDQVIALRWVNKNIASFGGDPNLVTIAGYSAGGFSVTLHLTSPMSKGLFHRAIFLSGAVLGKEPVVRHQFHLAQKQARLLNCPDDTSSNIINCLKTKSAQDIANTLPGFAEFSTHDPVLIWSPVLEPNFGQERFTVENPRRLVFEGKFERVPIMGGVTEYEFGSLAFDVAGNATLLREMDEDFERVAPISFQYERGTPYSKYISKQLRSFYLGNEPLNYLSLPGLIKLYADSVIGFGENRGVKVLAEKSNKPVYYYCLTYSGRYSFFYLPGTQTPLGASHHDDLMYLFHISLLFPRFNQTSPEYTMVRKLTTLFANFAYTGNPVPSSSNLLDNATWNRFTNWNKEYLEIGNKLMMKRNLFETRYRKWETLFPFPWI